MDKKEFKKMWLSFLVDIGLNNTDIAKEEGITKQSLGRKINDASIRYIDLSNIVERHGYTIEIRKKDSVK